MSGKCPERTDLRWWARKSCLVFIPWQSAYESALEGAQEGKLFCFSKPMDLRAGGLLEERAVVKLSSGAGKSRGTFGNHGICL
jgi:hypothetical protein